MKDCKHWLTCASNEKFYDVYNVGFGRAFKLTKGYLMVLNVDWFNPYKHIQYSVGALYVSIINVPHELRYRPENILLVGLIPGPREPQHNVN